MKNILLFLSLILCANSVSSQSIEFRDALNRKLITADLEGNSNSPHFLEPLQARITNVSSSSLQLHIRPGYIFECQDTTVQDLIITEDVMITLKQGESVDRVLKSMCIEQHNSAPGNGAVFKFSKIAGGSLLKLAEYINEKKYHNSMAQSAIWCLTDGSPVSYITGFDRKIAQDLREFTCALLGIPVPEWDEYDYKTNYNSTNYSIEIKGTMTFDLMKPTHIIIGLFNEEGILVRELYNINKLAQGSYRKTYSFDATVYTDAIYYIQLVEDGVITLKSTVDLSPLREKMQ
ncbi:MAG: hypothetical protein JW801_04985 [Bacteroidales bacterium]|nr:hypothetical protein [Bacteroidales bacterium]